MDQRRLSVVLATVERQWRALPSKQRPKAVWIAYYDPIPPDTDRIITPLLAVWFLDERGIRTGDAWAFVRFVTVHWVQPWCTRLIPEKDAVFGRVHEFGLAAFAEVAGAADVYLETMWGNLNGRGGRYAIDDQGDMTPVGPMWIS
jgi:hypothetical protein